MKRKKVFFTELAYIFGLAALAFGTALMVRADFGLSVVVAPAYLLHLKVAEFIPAFSFGMAEYTFQALLLVIMCLALRKFKPKFLLSFVAAVIYGLVLDASMALVGLLPPVGFWGRAGLFFAGFLLCAIGVSLLFHTYIPPEVYELFVKEVSAKTGANINLVKTIYDCVSCLVAVIMSFVFFGLWHFEGVKLGTVFSTLANGFAIGKFSAMFEHFFEFRDGLKLREKLG